MGSISPAVWSNWTRPKAGRRREIPMNRAVYDASSALPKAGERISSSTYRTAFEHADSRAKIYDFMFHGLRHTFASWASRWRRYPNCSGILPRR
jgi:integrase